MNRVVELGGIIYILMVFSKVEISPQAISIESVEHIMHFDLWFVSKLTFCLSTY